MSTCEQCGNRASELRGRSNLAGGKSLCLPCFENAEKAQREADPVEVARRVRIAREMEAFRAQQRLEERRAPNAEHYCELDQHHGRAEILASGLLLCRPCAQTLLERYDPNTGEIPLLGEAPVLVLERRVTELEAAIAELRAAGGRTGKAGGR